MLPSGRALLKLSAVMMLFTSLFMLLAIPGYWRNIWGISLQNAGTMYSDNPLLRKHRTHLNLHGHLSAVLQPPEVNLTDGGGRKRLLFEVLQAVPPVRAQIASDDFLEVDEEKKKTKL